MVSARNITLSGKIWLLTGLLLAFSLVVPSFAQAQSGFVYVNNQASSNSVSAFTAGTAGTLTQITGSPFLTGGVGANVVCNGLTRMAVSPANNLLFVANTGDRTITPFQINPATGVLTKTAGAPFPSGLTADSCQGFSLAVTPDGAFLMAASNGQIQTFSVAANGALAVVSSTANCCVPNTSMSISPDGRFLAVSNQTSVSMFTISAGALTPVAGSPFAKLGTGSLSALDFSCKADRLYGGEATATAPIAEGWVVDASGVLTPAPRSPFASSGTNGNIVLNSPDNTLLFQSNQSSTSVNSFVVNSDGSITNAGKFGGAGTVHIPVGMTTDATGTFLYVADDTFGVAAFRIGDGGVLASLGDLGINRPGQIQDVVAFPPRSCASADLVLNLSPLPNPAVAGAPIQYTVSVTNNGPATASAVVADALPTTLSAGGSALIANPSGANRINTISGSNVLGAVTITTTVPHQLFAGESVTVSAVHAPTTPNPIQSGAFLTDPGFNGVFTVASVPSPTTFTYSQTIPLAQFPSPTLLIAASTGAQRVGGVVTITSTSVFQLAPGTVVTIGGVANASFNGTFTVASQPSGTTFTYSQAGVDAVSGGGAVTGPQNIPPSDTAGGGSMSSPSCQVTVGAGTCSTATFAPHPPIVTAIRAANVVTITTNVPHQLSVGKLVTIQGVANTSFNGTFTIASVPTPTSFTYNQTAASASSSGGAVIGPGIVSQIVTFNGLAVNETRTALITGSTAGTTPNGTVITNRATISNMSVIDPVPGDTTKSVNVTIGATGGSTLIVPTATGPYGGVATVTATLTDSATSAPIAGKTIGFNFNQNNSHYSAVTNASGVATVSVPLGLTTVGTHPAAFTANFGGDSTYTASSATGDLIVTKAQLTVTADSLSRLYGDANPPLTYTITGFVNGDTIAVVTGTADCTTTATPASPAGTYPITCTVGTLAAQNYVFAFANGTLTVNPAPLTVTVADATRAYGDPNPAFTGTITGLKNGDSITATYSTTATITSPAGTYPITATLVDPAGVLPNYVVTTNNGTLTVTKAALVVTANNAARLYGDPNPTFTGTIAGIKNGDNITAIYTSTATPTSPVGTYPIIPTLTDNATGALANYTVTANNGSLTVSPAPLTVTAANATRAFGQPNPAFTGTIVGIKNADNITATYSTPATASSLPGTYPIIPALVDPTGKLGNYTVTINNGTLTITAAALTVTADNASRLYGDPNPTFTGTITGVIAGDNITATYASVATAASPVGTYSIVPTLSDNGTGALAKYAVTVVNGTLTVNPAPLTVAAANASRAYGAANPAFTGTITGIKNGDNITATYASTATAASNVGTYPITPTLVDPTSKLGNYTVTSNNGTLTVTAAPLVVTAGNATRVYGDPNPVFSGTITGLLNGDNITATYASAATPASPVGTYPIVPTLVDPTGKLGNYAVTSNNGTLTVTPAPLTVTAANATRAFGDPNPVFTGTITGLKNGDNITATYASTATATSPAGTYPIVPTLVDPTGKLGNYTVTSNNGTLTVTSAALVVTAANASRFYGDPNPVFTGTITGVKNGDTITATYASTAIATSVPGTYAIVPTLSDGGTGALANYTIVINNGTLTVTPAPLTVTAASASMIFGDPLPALTGAVTGIKNGENITAVYSTTATSASPVGTYPIVPAVSDNGTGALANYSVTISNGTLTINLAPLTVTAASASMIFGDPVPALSGTITGIRNGNNITATYSTAATSASPVGAYPIVATVSDNGTGVLANYAVTINNGTLTINAAPLTVTAASVARLYGDPNPAFTGTVVGLKNGDTIGAVFSSLATPASPIGNYAIVPTLLDPNNQAGNYAITSVNGILVVNPAPLSVVAADASRLYGDPDPLFTGAIVGIKNADNITATFASATDPTTTVGTYPIVPTVSDNATGALANYTVTVTNGTLTITPAPLTITADNLTSPVGTIPTFTGTIAGLKNTDVITATYTTTADPTSPAGTYPITPSADANPLLVNYAITLINGTLTLQ